MTAQSLDITVSNPTVTLTPAQDNTVTISPSVATVVVSASANQVSLSPADTHTVDIYDSTTGAPNPNNPFLDPSTVSATVGNILSVAGFCTITLRWITTGDCASVSIYRATSSNFAHAEKIGYSHLSAYTDAVEPGVTYTYWLEPVGYNGTVGALSLPHTTVSGNNATEFIDALGDITANHLSPALASLLNQLIDDAAITQEIAHDGAIASQVAYIDTQYGQLLQFVNQYKAEMDSGDSYSLAQLEAESLYFTTQTSALAQEITTLTAQVTTDKAEATAAINQEQTTRTSEVDAVATMVTALDAALSTDIADANALISSEAGTRANAVEAVAGQVTQLQTDFQTDLTSTQALVTQEASTRSAENLALAQTVSQLTADLTTTENNVNASLSNQDSTLVTLDASLASTQQTLQANYNTLSAGITSEAQARASATSALSGTITSHTTQLGDMSTTVLETSQSVDGIEGEYGVKIDANGRVTGFGLINGPGVSAFDIVADNFSIANPDTPATKDLYYDSAANTLKFRGQLILSNGANNTYTVTDLSDIQAQDGTDGVDGYTPVHGTDYFDGAPGLAGSNGQNGSDGSDGTNGSDGSPGAGFYRYGSPTGVWPNTATANSYLLAAAGRAVSQDDVLTIYSTDGTAVGETRRYNGSSWVTAALLLHGDMIAEGTITASRLAVGTLTADVGEITTIIADHLTTTTVVADTIVSNATITAPTINGGVIVAGNIAGGTISGGVIRGSVFVEGASAIATDAGSTYLCWMDGVSDSRVSNSGNNTSNSYLRIRTYNNTSNATPTPDPVTGVVLTDHTTNAFRYRHASISPSITGSFKFSEKFQANVAHNGSFVPFRIDIQVRNNSTTGAVIASAALVPSIGRTAGNDVTTITHNGVVFTITVPVSVWSVRIDNYSSHAMYGVYANTNIGWSAAVPTGITYSGGATTRLYVTCNIHGMSSCPSNGSSTTSVSYVADENFINMTDIADNT